MKIDFYTANVQLYKMESYATFKSWLYLQVELDSKAIITSETCTCITFIQPEWFM